MNQSIPMASENMITRFFSTAAQYPTTVSNYEMIIYILIKI